jgi:hypothetical protein
MEILHLEALCGPYAACGFGSPWAMKFVSGLPVALAAEHRAIVGELKPASLVRSKDGGKGGWIPSRDNVGKVEVLDGLLQRRSTGLSTLVLIHQLYFAQ